MFAATTSEDFISSSSTQQQQQKVQIIILSSKFLNSDNDEKSKKYESLKIENIHSVASVGWCLLKNKNSEKFNLSSSSLQKMIQESKERFESISGKKATMNDDQDVEIIMIDDDKDDHKQEIFDSVLLSTSTTTLLIYRCNELSLSSSIESNNKKKTDESGSKFLNLLLPSLTPSHGLSRQEFDQKVYETKELSIAPFAVIQPKMHRRIPLMMKTLGKGDDDDDELLFRQSVTLNQVVMEVLQKGGLLGKYGA